MRRTLLPSLFLLAACGIGPDGNSGTDGKRSDAPEIKLDEWATDENGIDYGHGDRTDWKRFVVPRNGTLFVEVAFDNANVKAVVALYDRYGRKLGEKAKEKGKGEPVKFEGEVGKGKYFVQVMARDSEDKSIYSVRVSMEGGSNIGDIPPPE